MECAVGDCGWWKLVCMAAFSGSHGVLFMFMACRRPARAHLAAGEEEVGARSMPYRFDDSWRSSKSKF